MAGRTQRHLRFGEGRVDEHRTARGQGPCHQDEGLRGPGGQQDLRRVPAVSGGDGNAGGTGVGITGAGVHGVVQHGPQPGRGRAGPHVDRQVDQARLQLGVPVMPEIGHAATATVDPADHGLAHHERPASPSAAASATEGVPTSAATRPEGDGTAISARSAGG